MALSLSNERLAAADHWFFSDAKWPVYRTIIHTAQQRHIPFAVGGGFAQMAYAGRPHDAKDLDLFLPANHRDAVIEITREAGLHDYHDEKPYDRNWIYRAAGDGVIVDVIWSMANRRSQVDCVWVEHGPEIRVDGATFRLIPIEELLWTKLYIMQRERCDWPDALNLLSTSGPDINWRHLLHRLGDDRPLLQALLSVFSWLCPERASTVPDWLWRDMGIAPPHSDGAPDLCRKRADFFDSRPWLVPAIQGN